MFDKIKSKFAAKKQDFTIFSPVSGNVISITEVADPTFSQEILGTGVAITPTSYDVLSPVNGTVEQMFSTGHAVTVVSDSGIEILIHIGIDTVKLKGEGFTAICKDGDKVSVGDKLMSFDPELIESRGFDDVIPIIITNPTEFEIIKPINLGPIEAGAPLMEAKKL